MTQFTFRVASLEPDTMVLPQESTAWVSTQWAFFISVCAPQLSQTWMLPSLTNPQIINVKDCASFIFQIYVLENVNLFLAFSDFSSSSNFLSVMVTLKFLGCAPAS